MEETLNNFWKQLISNYGIQRNGEITKGIFKGRTMAEVYDYFAKKAWDYPSMIQFLSGDTDEYDASEYTSMHPEPNEFELFWGCNMEFDT